MGWGRARFFFVVALLVLFFAGAQNAFVDASRDEAVVADSILADYPADVIAKRLSRSWQFKDRQAANGPAFPGADTYLVAVTDFFHWARFWQMTFLSLGAMFLFWCGYYWPVNLRLFGRVALGLALLVFGHLAYLGGAIGLAYHALPAGSHDWAQMVARTWVDGFMLVHAELQSRGFLG